MIITQPDDGCGLLYHVVDLLGQTVHAYRHHTAATTSLEGDQRIFVQDEKTREWLSGEPRPLSTARSARSHARVSAATISYVDVMRRAHADNALILASSILIETGEPVAILIAVAREDNACILTPLRMLTDPSGEMISPQSAVTDAAKSAFNRLRKQLGSKAFQAWFGLDAHGHPTMTMAAVGKAPAPHAPAQVILPWENPYELFSSPVLPTTVH